MVNLEDIVATKCIEICAPGGAVLAVLHRTEVSDAGPSGEMKFGGVVTQSGTAAWARWLSESGDSIMTTKCIGRSEYEPPGFTLRLDNTSLATSNFIAATVAWEVSEA